MYQCILLSNIDTMPLNLQVLLFNELKYKNSNSKSIFSKKKIIATTSKNIKNILRNNNFSNDLFYELDMYNIYTLPLRERPEDIKQLVKGFIFEYNKKNNTNKQLDLDSFIHISGYMWPGNIKQLKNFIYRVLNIYDLNIINSKNILKELTNEFNYDEKNYIEDWKKL